MSGIQNLQMECTTRHGERPDARSSKLLVAYARAIESNRRNSLKFCNSELLSSALSRCYFAQGTLSPAICVMEIDFQAIQTDDLKSRIGELRRYL